MSGSGYIRRPKALAPEKPQEGAPRPKNYITQGGFKRLTEELNQLWKVERPALVTTVAWAAANGDRSENGDYLYGKRRLREIDRRVRFLSKRLDIAEVVDNTGRKHDRVFFGATVTYENAAGFQGAMAWHPSFGLNATYYGGSYLRGAFPTGNGDDAGSNPPSGGGRFYIRRTDEIRQTDQFIVLASSRAGDIKNAGSYSATGWGNTPPPVVDRTVPGYYELRPPRPSPFGQRSGGNGGGRSTPWNASNAYNAALPPETWGFIDFRHFKKSIVGFADGHVEAMEIETLRDMRRWSNRATKADWNYTPNQN